MPKFERVEEIDVPVPKVWATLIDVGLWDDFIPGFGAAAGGAQLAKGSQVPFAAGDKQGIATVTTFEPDRRLEVVTDVGGQKTTHNFMLSASGGFLGAAGNKTKVEYEMEYSAPGGFIGAFFASGNPVDLIKVKRALDAIEKLAESPSAAAAAGGGQSAPPAPAADKPGKPGQSSTWLGG